MNPAAGGRPGFASRGAMLALAALVLGLAIGMITAATGSEGTLRLVDAIAPVGVLWVNAIRMTVIPLIVASLIVATAGTEARAVGRLGTRSFAVFLALLLMLAIFATVTAPLLFQYLTVDAGAAESIRSGADTLVRPPLPSFASWLVSAVPANPIGAAVDGAMLPLVVFALLFGLALGRLPAARREPAYAVFRSIADAMLVLVSWILVVAPIGIFALALPLAARLGTGVVGAVGFYLAAHSGLLLAATLVLYVIIAVLSRAPVGRFARAALAPQLVAVTTRSSLAALPANVVAAERGLGLPSALTSFALPLAVSVFRLNQPISWLAMALFASKLYGVELGLASIVTLAVTSVLMSFSVPGIPSGSLFIVAPFFAAHGIPPESIGVLIALDLVPDVFKTLCNVTGHLTAVTLLHDTVTPSAESS